jgi:hypothetical protein
MSRKRQRRPTGTVRAGGPGPPANASVGPDDLERPADDEATLAEGYGGIRTSSTRHTADATTAGGEGQPATAAGDGPSGPEEGRPGSRRRRPARSDDLPRGPGGRMTDSLRSASPFPPFFRSLGEGGLALAGHLAPLLSTLAFVPLYWIVLLAMGLDHFPTGMAAALAFPPISSLADFGFGQLVVGVNWTTLVLAAVAALARGAVFALIAGMVAEAVEFRQVTLVGVLRGLRAAPTIAVLHLALLITLLSLQLFLVALGQIGQLLYSLVLAGGVYLLAFAPAVAVREQGRIREVIRRSVRAAILPGSRHLVMTLVYFLAALGLFLSMTPTGVFTVNPSWGAWAYVLGGSLFHGLFLATFTYRWIAVEATVSHAPLRFRRQQASSGSGRPARRR